MIRTSFQAAVALAAAAAAQTIPTTPTQSVLTEGAATSLVFAAPGDRLTQTIYESRLVYRAIASYRTLHFRPDGGVGQHALPGIARHLTIGISGIGVPSPELASHTSFAANRGTDHTTVLNDRLVSFPPAAQRPNPAPFTVAVPLDRPFPTIGIGHLLVEIATRDEGTSPAQWLADAEHFAAADWTILASIAGTECPAGTIGYGAMHRPSQSVQPGALVTTISMARQAGQPASHAAFAIVGTNRSHWARRLENRRGTRRFSGRRAPSNKAVEAFLVVA